MGHISKKGSKTREGARHRRKVRVRARVLGTAEKPRLCVYRSLRFTYAQLISDDDGTVIASATTKGEEKKMLRSVGGAKELGLKIAKLAKDKKIEKIVFDRNGYLYHGRVAAVAEGAREGGLKF